MEEELGDDLPGGTLSPSSEVEEALGTSSTAQEVEEEIIQPASTSIEGQEDVTRSMSTSLRREDDCKAMSFSPSAWETTSDSVGPQGQSPGEMSSLPLDGSENLPSSASSSPVTSPLSWKMQQEEGEYSQEAKDTGSPGQSQASLQPDLKKAKRKAVTKTGALSRSCRLNPCTVNRGCSFPPPHTPS